MKEFHVALPNLTPQIDSPCDLNRDIFNPADYFFHIAYGQHLWK